MINYKRLPRKLKKKIKKDLGVKAYISIVRTLQRTITVKFSSVKVAAKTSVLRASVTREMIEDISSFKHEMSDSTREYLMQDSNSQDFFGKAVSELLHDIDLT